MVKTETNSILDWYPMIIGKEFTGEAKNTPRLNPVYYQLFLDMLEEDNIAKEFFNIFEMHDDFFSTAVDFNHFIPSDQRAEVFYAAKLGKGYREIPSFCAYVLDKAWKQCNGIPNLITKVIPISYLKRFCYKNYFVGSVTLHDAICNVCTDQYSPFTRGKLKNLVKDEEGNEFYEIYIRETDMVAAVPTEIGEKLAVTDIENITMTPNGLQTGGKYIRTMASHFGAVNSYYDLRKVI